jgi:hypothetical protein
MFTLILFILAFTLGYLYANAKHNNLYEPLRTLRIPTTTAKTHTESSAQTPELVYCYTCKLKRTVLAAHKCISLTFESTPPPNISTYRDRTYTLKELQFPAQLGDILLKLRYNQRLGHVDAVGLQSVENNRILADWGRSKGIKGTSDKVIGETVEAIFSQELTLLDEYLDNRGLPPISPTSVKLPSL